MGQTGYYQSGNAWQRNRYLFMSEYNKANGITKFGKAKQPGNRYYHIVDIDNCDCQYNLLGDKRILEALEKRFQTKAGDKARALTNTVASQPCCFNLFAPLKFPENRSIADTLFSSLLRKPVRIDDIIIEFTPEQAESLGDQTKTQGTDADVAVFYSDGHKKKGLILIEFKYIENEFSLCTSYKNKKDIRPICNSKSFHRDKFERSSDRYHRPLCGYMRYENWPLTKNSSVFDLSAIKKSNACPFRYSLNQLWRNMLLAEKTARVRKFEAFHFWVVSPRQNEWLWKEHGKKLRTISEAY